MPDSSVPPPRESAGSTGLAHWWVDRGFPVFGVSPHPNKKGEWKKAPAFTTNGHPLVTDEVAGLLRTGPNSGGFRQSTHDSGLCSADAGTRRDFARDLDNLTLASPSLNRSQKSDKDAAEWMPEQNRCWFAQTIVDVRLKYGLTIDQAEADAIDRMLGGCTSTAISCSIR